MSTLNRIEFNSGPVCQDDYLFEVEGLFYECTEIDKHKGDHVASDRIGQIFATWTRGSGQWGIDSRETT